MLNRRFLREKTLQALYSFYQQGGEDLATTEKNLIFGAHKLYELYVQFLSCIVEIADVAARRADEGKLKFLPTDEERNPNMRFIHNRMITQIRENPVYALKTNAYKLNWHAQEDLFRNIFMSMIKSESFKAYMENVDDSYELDKKYVCSFFKRKITPNSLLFHYFEEESIYWADDYENVAFWVLKSLKALEEDSSEVIISEEHFIPKDDLDFAKDLLRKTVAHGENSELIIRSYLENWELERTPLIDLIILKMAITELTEFPSIPVKVTLNEYIELTKKFSLDRSRIFVNGLLNKLIEDYTRDGKIKKTGRGLI